VGSPPTKNTDKAVEGKVGDRKKEENGK